MSPSLDLSDCLLVVRLRSYGQAGILQNRHGISVTASGLQAQLVQYHYHEFDSDQLIKVVSAGFRHLIFLESNILSNVSLSTRIMSIVNKKDIIFQIFRVCKTSRILYFCFQSLFSKFSFNISFLLYFFSPALFVRIFLSLSHVPRQCSSQCGISGNY